jgi:hypothetical protein
VLSSLIQSDRELAKRRIDKDMRIALIARRRLLMLRLGRTIVRVTGLLETRDDRIGRTGGNALLTDDAARSGKD